MVDWEKRARDQAEEIDWLREENISLTDEVKELRRMLRGGDNLFRFNDLTKSENIILQVLMENRFTTRTTILRALYAGDGREPRGERIVDVFLQRIRKRLRPLGVEINTIWGQGFEIPEASKARVRKLKEAS